MQYCRKYCALAHLCLHDCLESQMASPDPATYDIIVEMTFIARASLDIVGNEYSVGIGVDIDSEEIWVTRFTLTVIANNLDPFVSAQ